MFSKKNFFLFLIIVLVIFTRFYGLDWGNGFFFHPDENNMAVAVSQLSDKNLNPHFFAYGQLPLYLSYFFLKIINLPNKFENAVLSLRALSAVLSCFSILFFYLISKRFFKKNIYSVFFVLSLVFCPGLIQLAHFGTTESLLIFIFAASLFLSLKIYSDKFKIQYLVFASLLSGIGLATKITAIFFVLPILLSLFFRFFRKQKKILFLSLICYLIMTAIFILIFSPFNFLALNEFLDSMRYETSVAIGSLKVFYTNQFLNTIPYVFQLQKVFPYVCGIPVFIFGIIGFFVFIFNIKKIIVSAAKFKQYLLILMPSIIYFLYNGQLYTKWSRFMSPIFFIFPFFFIFFLSKIRNKIIVYILFFISIAPGVMFLNLYFQKDIRVIASEWINKNIPEESKIISESRNVFGIPLIPKRKFYIFDFDVYELDQDNDLQEKIIYELFLNDYIFIPSRRVFKNQNNNIFPISQKYYHHLFDGSLGFVKIKEFSTKTDFVLNPENGEETWTVFDNPTIRIFKKQRVLDLDEIRKILK